MAKRQKSRKRRKRRIPHISTDNPRELPVTRRFGKITEPNRLFSLRHKGKLKRNKLNSEPVYNMAKWVIDKHNCDFHAAWAERRTSNADIWDWSECQPIYDNFSYEKMGTIELYQGTFTDKRQHVHKDFFIIDGVHRCVALTCLLLQNKIEFQPISVEIDFYGKDAGIPSLP